MSGASLFEGPLGTRSPLSCVVEVGFFSGHWSMAGKMYKEQFQAHFPEEAAGCLGQILQSHVCPILTRLTVPDVSLSFATFRWGGALARAKVNRIAFRGVLRMLAHQDACSF